MPRGQQRPYDCFSLPVDFKGTSLYEHYEHKGKFFFNPIYTKKDQDAGKPYEFFNGLEWKEGGRIKLNGYEGICLFALGPQNYEGPYQDYDAFIKVTEKWAKQTYWVCETEELFLLGGNGSGMFPNLTYGLKIVAQPPATPEPAAQHFNNLPPADPKPTTTASLRDSVAALHKEAKSSPKETNTSVEPKVPSPPASHQVGKWWVPGVPRDARPRPERLEEQNRFNASVEFGNGSMVLTPTNIKDTDGKEIEMSPLCFTCEDTNAPDVAEEAAALSDISGSMNKVNAIVTETIKSKETDPLEYAEMKVAAAKIGLTMGDLAKTGRIAVQKRLFQQLLDQPNKVLDPRQLFHFSKTASLMTEETFIQHMVPTGGTSLAASLPLVYAHMKKLEPTKHYVVIITTDEKLPPIPWEMYFNDQGIQYLFIVLGFTSYDALADKSTMSAVEFRSQSRYRSSGSRGFRATDARSRPSSSTLVTSQGDTIQRITNPAADIGPVCDFVGSTLREVQDYDWMRVYNPYPTGFIIRSGGVVAILPPCSDDSPSCVVVPKPKPGDALVFASHVKQQK